MQVEIFSLPDGEKHLVTPTACPQKMPSTFCTVFGCTWMDTSCSERYPCIRVIPPPRLAFMCAGLSAWSVLCKHRASCCMAQEPAGFRIVWFASLAVDLPSLFQWRRTLSSHALSVRFPGRVPLTSLRSSFCAVPSCRLDFFFFFVFCLCAPGDVHRETVRI